MKIILAILIFAFFTSGHIQAQPETNIHIDWAEKRLLLNLQSIDKHTSIIAIRQLLGNETKILSDPQQPTRLHQYENIGLAFVIDSVKGILHRIDIIWSPGRNSSSTAPESFFSGIFEIDKYSISKTDSIEKISQATGIKHEEWSPGFYWYTMKNDMFDLTFAYATKQRNRIRQVHIVLESLSQ